MTSKANLRRGKIGLPTHVTISLENDVVTIIDKSQKVLLNAPLRELTDVGHSFGMIAFKVNDEYFSLEFISMTSKFFGLLGMMLSKGRATAKEWRKEFESKGIPVKKQLM